MPLLTPLLALLAAAPLAASIGGIVLAPPAARPGDAVLVRVPLGGADREPAGSVAGRPLRFWRSGTEARALAALAVETAPGQVAVEVTSGPLGPVRASAMLDVLEPGFASRTLSVAPKFVSPPREVKKRIERDKKAFAAAYDRPFSPPLFSGGFDWPRRDRLTGHFGDQRVLNGKKESVHYGLDLHAPRGAPVLAANDGEVVLARDAYYSGKSVVLSHGAAVFTIYFHMDRIDVRPGAKVKKGEQIGIVGSTGRSTGPHLHWSARVAGMYVDPESLLGIDFATGTAAPRHSGPPVEPPPGAAVATPEGRDAEGSAAPVSGESSPPR